MDKNNAENDGKLNNINSVPSECKKDIFDDENPPTTVISAPLTPELIDKLRKLMKGKLSIPADFNALKIDGIPEKCGLCGNSTLKGFNYFMENKVEFTGICAECVNKQITFGDLLRKINEQENT